MNPQYPPTILGGAAFSRYVDELRDDIKQIGLNNFIVAGQEPENGIFFLNEKISIYKMISIVLIFIGVVSLKIF